MVGSAPWPYKATAGRAASEMDEVSPNCEGPEMRSKKKSKPTRIAMDSTLDKKKNGPPPDQAKAGGSSDTQPLRAGALEQPPGNVDKIRDILFGSQMRDYENHFIRLEEMKETTRKRFENLESYVKKELESVQARMKTERDERSEATKLLSRELKGLSELLGQKTAELDDHVTESHRQLRADILQQSKDIGEEIERKQDEIASALERRFQELRGSKTDRAMLADLLTEVALRLKDEFSMPTAAV
jgi:hypothetical protein